MKADRAGWQRSRWRVVGVPARLTTRMGLVRLLLEHCHPYADVASPDPLGDFGWWWQRPSADRNLRRHLRQLGFRLQRSP